MNRRGLTLVELIVAVSIFIIVTTFAIGTFVSIIRARMLIGNMRESQQKIRTVNETISRYAKEANYVKIPTAGETIPIPGDTLDMYFDSNTAATRISLVSTPTAGEYDLMYYECTDPARLATHTCASLSDWGVPTGWNTGVSLLGGKVVLLSSALNPNGNPVFGLSGTRADVLDVKLLFRNGAGIYRDDISIVNSVYLEGLK